MDFKRLAANQWINRILLIVIIVFSCIVTFLITQIDSIVNGHDHGQLYQYGLKFSLDWANPYWNYITIMFAGLAVTIVLSAVLLLLGFIRPKPKLAETIIKQEQPQPKTQPTPAPQPIQTQPIVETPPKQQPPPATPQPQPVQPQPKPQPKFQIQTPTKPQPEPQPAPAVAAVQEQKPKAGKSPKENVKAANNCPSCKKSFTQPLVMLDFEGGKSKLVNVCPYCNQVLGDAEGKTD